MPRRIEDFRGLTHLSRLTLLAAVQKRPGQRLADLADAARTAPWALSPWLVDQLAQLEAAEPALFGTAVGAGR